LWRRDAALSRERTWECYSLRATVVRVIEVCPLKTGLLHVLQLRVCWGKVLFVERYSFLGSRIMPDSSRTTFVGHAIVHNRGVMDDRLIHVGIVDDRSIHVNDSSVVLEIVIVPFTADKSYAHVAKPVIDAAVVADMPSPISWMEDVNIVIPTPVRRSPQCALIRSWNPGTGNPIVLLSVVVVRPITRGPNEIRFRARRLYIYRKSGGRESHADEYARMRRCRDDQGKSCYYKRRTYVMPDSHGTGLQVVLGTDPKGRKSCG